MQCYICLLVCTILVLGVNAWAITGDYNARDFYVGCYTTANILKYTYIPESKFLIWNKFCRVWYLFSANVYIVDNYTASYAAPFRLSPFQLTDLDIDIKTGNLYFASQLYYPGGVQAGNKPNPNRKMHTIHRRACVQIMSTTRFYEFI